MSQSDTKNTLYIAGLGTFKADRVDVLDQYCFTQDRTFHSQDVTLVIYSNDDGTWPSERQRQSLLDRYEAFESTVEFTLAQLPKHLEPLCDLYQIDISNIPKSEIISGLEWHNVKLEPNGNIECYTMNKAVSKSLDIVIRFSSPRKISEVYFDG